jgi:hypothetical protein
MSVGPIYGHSIPFGGNVQVILTDGDGNIKSIQTSKNVINGPWATSAMFSGFFGGNGISVCSRYIYLISIKAAYNPSTSAQIPFSNAGVPVGACGGETSGAGTVTANPLTCSAQQAAGFGVGEAGVVSWVVSGTFCFSGQVGLSSVGGVVLVWNPTEAILADSLSISWFAQATFAQLAITSLDKLTIQWYFSVSTRTAQL